MSRLRNLNAYLYFDVVARRGSITRAAEELSVSPSAVSQQIKLLEQQMGIKLFRREGRSISLTLEGEQMYQASATAIRMLQDAERHLGKRRETLRLNLRVMPSFGVRWLGPRLTDFVQKHPNWDLRVDAAPDPTDFDREIMDFDIRYGTTGWAGYHSVPVMSDQVLPLCSPALRDALHERHDGDPQKMLDGAKLIDSARALCSWDLWLHQQGMNVGSNQKSILLDRSSLSLQMAVDGAGVVLESLALASGEVARGDLVPVTPQLPVLEFPAYWLVCPHRHLSRRAVRIFVDWMEEQTKGHARTVAGLLESHGLTVQRIDAERELVSGPSLFAGDTSAKRNAGVSR